MHELLGAEKRRHQNLVSSLFGPTDQATRGTIPCTPPHPPSISHAHGFVDGPSACVLTMGQRFQLSEARGLQEEATQRTKGTHD